MNLIECANLKCQKLFEEPERFCPSCKSPKWRKRGQTVRTIDNIKVEGQTIKHKDGINIS